MCHPSLSVSGRVDPPTKLSKRGDLTGSQFLEGVAGYWLWVAMTFFKGGDGEGVVVFT